MIKMTQEFTKNLLAQVRTYLGTKRCMTYGNRYTDTYTDTDTGTLYRYQVPNICISKNLKSYHKSPQIQ